MPIPVNPPAIYQSIFSDDKLKAIADKSTSEPEVSQSIAPKQHSMLWPMLAAGVGDVGDIISTRVAMAHGADEANPLVPGKKHPWGNTAMLGAQALGTQLLIRALGKSHPTVAKLLGYGTGGLGAFNTVRNMHLANEWDDYNAQHK